MRFQTSLIPAVLIRRYKRFLADARLEDGTEIKAHCANPGSMMGLAEPGSRIWLEPNDDPKKKLDFGWRLLEFPNGHFVGVDTSVPNRALKEALLKRNIPQLAHYSSVRSEVKYGKNSRIDFLLSEDNQPDLFLEVKSVTLSRTSGLAEFPDSVTKRGTKHLVELQEMTRLGHRAMMFYMVQRTDATAVTLAHDIDPNYADAFRQAQTAGVKILAFDCSIDPAGIEVGKELPFLFPDV